ncbi:phosphate ABC transporter substrate-binding protein, partial [Paraburkholderia sp. Se-20369]|nr:phosphate ABC transporter substrate-binding protein [Paraburkholderia sp. Se-20369]
RALGDAQAARLRDALDTAVALDAARAQALRLRGFERLVADDYAVIERFAAEAAAHGYPVLA